MEVYTQIFFVRDIWNPEKGEALLETIHEAHHLLEAATGDSAGYHSFVNLEDRSFEEAEQDFRNSWEQTGLFNPEPRSESLELVGIVRFT